MLINCFLLFCSIVVIAATDFVVFNNGWIELRAWFAFVLSIVERFILIDVAADCVDFGFDLY